MSSTWTSRTVAPCGTRSCPSGHCIRAISDVTVRHSSRPAGPARAKQSAEYEAAPELEPPRAIVKASSVALTPSRPSDPARSDMLLEATMAFLREELPRMFSTGKVTRSRYADTIFFQDPISKYTEINGYCFNIALLHQVFNIKFELFDVASTGPGTIETRWSMDMRFKLLPWQPSAVITGISKYTVDERGLITSHIDYWDACKRNDFLSLEALQYILSSLSQVRLTPDLESPDYVVLYKTPEYEIRQYQPYTVAEVAMPAGSGPAGGAGFTDLAGYIFGGNNERVNMEMTTPVYSTAGQAGPNANRMQFVMERRFASKDKLPTPASEKISSKVESSGVRAAITFSGFPLDFEVVQAERKLRAALNADGVANLPGYLLARYNEPTVPPFLKRNEVLIDLPDYKLPSLKT